MRNFFKNNKLAVIVYFVLFIIPFFWHKLGQVDYGGDSTRLYLYNPSSWLNNVALYFVNSLPPLGEAMPNFSLIPFLGILIFLKKILFDSSFYLNNFVNGFFLSGGFFLVYLTITELFDRKKDELEVSVCSIVAGLFFVFSPLLIFSWERALYSFVNQIFVYPLLFFLFLRFIKSGKIVFLIFMSFFCFIFAMNFSYPTLPWLLAFFSFSFLFLFVYSVIIKKTKLFIKGILIFLSVSALINCFDILPQIYSFTHPSSQLSLDFQSIKNAGLSYFLSVQPHIRLTYNLIGQDQYVITSGFNLPLKSLIYDYGIKYLPLFFSYPVLIILGMILKRSKFSDIQKKTMNILLLFYLVILFFMTANITNLDLAAYKMLFRFSWFSMFRSFYSKFSTVYVYFYSLILGFSLIMVFNNIKSLKIKGIIVSFLTILILLNGWPLISGKVVNTILYNSTNVSISSAIKPQYEIFADLVKKQNQNFKILSFPLTNENYQVLKGKEGGAYFGPSSLTVLTGKNSFNGLKGFSVFGSQFQKMIEDKNYQSLNRLFGLLNIGYLFYDSDDYIYNSFPIHSYFPYSEWLKTIFPDQRAIGDFVNKLGFEKLFAVDSYNFYKANDLLPHIFVPKKIVVSNSGQNVLSKIIDFDNYNNRTAIYLTDTEAIKTGESELISSADSIFIEAKNNDKESIDIQNNYYYGEIFYPYIKEKSFLLWKLTLLNEYYQKWLSKANTGELIGKKIFYANKRINELITFKNKEKDQLKIYSDEIRGIIKILENTKDINLRNQSAFRLIINLEDNLSRLSYAGVSNYNLWEEIINQTIIEAKKYVSKVKIDEREYSLDIPKSGKYNVFLKGLPDTAQAYKTTPDYILEINDRRYDKFSENFSAEENGWVNWGQYDFGEGKTNIKLANNVSKDYLSQSKWYPFQQAPIYYKEALDWRAGIWYQLKGELKSGKRVNLAIVEKQGNIDDGRWRLKEIPQYKVLKQFIFSEYQKEFDCLVKFSYGATSAGVMIIDDKNQFLLEEVGQAFKDFKLVEVFEPEIILENVESVEPTKKSFPKITFTKINPTKYHVKVEEAKDKAYGIVFSENFDPGWRLYNVKNKTESKETTASYFEGEVQEGKHTNIFLDSNTFETWGKNPISEDKHFLVNGYANLWLVSPEDVGSQKEYELVLEFYPQRYFYFGLLISGIIFLACLRYVIYSLNKKLN